MYLFNLPVDFVYQIFIRNIFTKNLLPDYISENFLYIMIYKYKNIFEFKMCSL